jgi:hypothetical protein
MGKFEKKQLTVGLSESLPMQYDGATQKYQLSDYVQAHAAKFTYTSQVLQLELEGTANEILTMAFGRDPKRFVCHTLVASLPESALDEAKEELLELRQHYFAIERERASVAALPSPGTVSARVSGPADA